MTPEPGTRRGATATATTANGSIAVEPGGNEPIPDAERHGRPRQLFWTWTSPNLEFATIFVGVLAVPAFGLTFGQAVAAIVLGNGLAAVAHGVLSARGPLAACRRWCWAGSRSATAATSCRPG